VTRVVVIGDVGGHPAELHVGLATVNATVGGELRPDTVVVQVGDLVDRGPDSAGVLAIVRRYLDRQPDQWLQLIGNHEGQHLPFGTRFWPGPLAEADSAQLNTWWERRQLNVAAAVRTSAGDEFLLTHAGLTVPAWQDLGEPATAAQAAGRLNQRPEWLLRRDGMSEVDNRGAGPLWADAGWDLYEPWLRLHTEGGFVPFGQIHGHSTIVHFENREFHCPGRIRERASVDWTNRHTRVRIGGRVFIGVDPKHGRAGAAQWRPLVLDDATVLSSQEVGCG
jgi:hypothetical protein